MLFSRNKKSFYYRNNWSYCFQFLSKYFMVIVVILKITSRHISWLWLQKCILFTAKKNIIIKITFLRQPVHSDNGSLCRMDGELKTTAKITEISIRPQNMKLEQVSRWTTPMLGYINIMAYRQSLKRANTKEHYHNVFRNEE